MRIWVDPPSGWQYGFPKVYDDEKDGNVEDWLVGEGYPESSDFGIYYRMWPVEEEEQKE